MGPSPRIFTVTVLLDGSRGRRAICEPWRGESSFQGECKSLAGVFKVLGMPHLLGSSYGGVEFELVGLPT